MYSNIIHNIESILQIMRCKKNKSENPKKKIVDESKPNWLLLEWKKKLVLAPQCVVCCVTHNCF